MICLMHSVHIAHLLVDALVDVAKKICREVATMLGVWILRVMAGVASSW